MIKATALLVEHIKPNCPHALAIGRAIGLHLGSESGRQWGALLPSWAMGRLVKYHQTSFSPSYRSPVKCTFGLMQLLSHCWVTTLSRGHNTHWVPSTTASCCGRPWRSIYSIIYTIPFQVDWKKGAGIECADIKVWLFLNLSRKAIALNVSSTNCKEDLGNDLEHHMGLKTWEMQERC